MKADIVLVGVSRSGKTRPPQPILGPYNNGIKAPTTFYFTGEERYGRWYLKMRSRPKNTSRKLFGLTIEAERLHRESVQERRANGRYASLAQWSLGIA